jgi:ComF family protein
MFFPAVFCPFCGGSAGIKGFCQDCSRKMLALPRCKNCGDIMENGVCLCGREIHPFKMVLSAALYEGQARRNILAFKYEGKTFLARSFSALMRDVLEMFCGGVTFDCIVPVPLGEKRLRERGYNQAAILAKALSRLLDTPADNALLRRVKETPPLKDMKKEERRLTLKDAFKCGANKYKTALLTDDVFTSGSTATACAEALRQGGVSMVYVITLAKTPLFFSA